MTQDVALRYPTKRFSDRVENYIKFRPTYPSDVIDFMTGSLGLKSAMSVADVGSGTGILTALLLKNGNTVYAVEPNPQMRRAAETALRANERFISIDGRSEETTLTDHGVDFVFAAQAFHWFDVPKTKIEFKRILRPNGKVVIIWNDRIVESQGQGLEYELLLEKYASDYKMVKVSKLIENKTLSGFFSPAKVNRVDFRNFQDLDWPGFEGRLLSSSYCPQPGEPHHDEILAGLKDIFKKYAHNGIIRMNYETKVFYGTL